MRVNGGRRGQDCDLHRTPTKFETDDTWRAGRPAVKATGPMKSKLESWLVVSNATGCANIPVNDDDNATYTGRRKG
jgi:hypothetical protein